MKRLCPVRLDRAAFAALFALAIAPGGALAEPTSDVFQLKNVSNEPGRSPITVESVAALIVPPGAVVPSNPNESPLTVLPGSTGFDKDKLEVLLGEGNQNGSPAQALGLDFGPEGFKPGAILNFELDISPIGTKVSLSPELVVPEAAKGSITIGSVTPVPEPGALALWAAIASATAFALRARRRR